MLSRFFLVLGIVALAGCPAPWIRGPSLYPGDPAAERASFTQNDPLPDSSLGPNTSGRPREAYTQRSEPRRTIEASIPAMTSGPYIQSPFIQGNQTPQMMPGPPSSYPNTISP